MSGIYSNEQDRCHINPYANQPPSSDPVIFTSPAQWKTFPVEKQGHVTSPHNNHAVMTTATLGSSHGNQVMVNLEPKSLHNYAAYYPPWSATGPLHLPAVGGHGSFGQMLGTVDPPRVCVPVSAPLNRQDIIPVVANVNHAGSAVNMAPVHVGRDGSVAMAASHRQEMDGASMVVAHMPGAMQKEYWPSAVSSMHAENIIANSGLVASAGQTSYSVLGSVTSCSYASAGSVMSQLENSKFQPTRDRSPIYQAGLQEAVVPSSCGKVVKEMTYSIPTASQSYPDVTSSGASMNEATLHQSYHKTVTSSNVTDNQTVDSSHHEDIVAKALSQSLNSDSDVTGHYGNSIQFGDVRQTFSTVDKPVQFASDLCNSVNNSSYGSTVRQDFVSSEQKPGRRGPGRPPGSAVSGDDDHKSKPYECEYCERRFKHTQQRRVHVMSHTGERPHVCPYCQKGFKTLAQKTDHIRVHTGDKPYKCTICWREFGKYATMKKHLNTHLDTPPYPCPHCDRAFYLAERLKVHVREHTDERPFKCDECERAFRNPNHLKFHKMVHSGEVPFRCEICWKGFQDKVKFDRHQICHQNDNLLRCANCQLGFARVEEMTEHFETCRAGENSTKTPTGWVSF